MCGLLANIVFSGAVDVDRFQVGLGLLRHRGPDGAGTWVSPDGRVALGHTRLSIVGGLDGVQPLAGSGLPEMAIVNGEFYNYQDIYRELNYHPLAASDSEVLLPMYSRFGAAGISRLRGEFAFVIWDPVNNVMVAGRDQFGVKPLYYCFYGKGVAISSEIKALFELGAARRWNNSGIHGSERMLYPARGTCFDGIEQVPPGALMTFDGAGSVSIASYNQDALQRGRRGSEGGRDYVSAFKSAFDDAVHVRIASEQKVACYLSGGIDSCAVLATASELSGRPPDSFTISFKGSPHNEDARASSQAKMSRSYNHVVEVSEQDIVDNFEDAVRAFEIPFGNSHGVAKLLLSRAVREAGFKVVLTGEGSDEILGGYPHFQSDVISTTSNNACGTDSPLPHHFREGFARFPGFLIEGAVEPDLVSFGNSWGYMPTMLRTGSARGGMFVDLYTDDFRKYHALAAPYTSILKDLRGRPISSDVLHRSMWLWQNTVLPGYILNALGDRAEMANSIEARLPFLDQELYSAVREIPSKLKSDGEVGKIILRECMDGRVHPDVINCGKVPFMSPAARVKGGCTPFRSYMGDVFASNLLRDQNFYCPVRVKRMFDGLTGLDERAAISADRILTFVLSVCILNRAFRVERGV
ncbi:asparagine synthase (glutamine-hydrolyzing) [Stenotrophomonas maltophilia]